MTDRELLEAAAKAAGYDDAEYQDGGDWMEVRYGFREAVWSKKQDDESGSGYWNPLTENSDALRLAATLRLSVHYSQYGPDLVAITSPCGIGIEQAVFNEDSMEATRRAIVRAAAEIGKRV
jgi:hypothetical protein